MKYYSETRYFVRRNAASIWREDCEIRTEKHEISEKAFRFYVDEVYADRKPLKNKDGSITYAVIQNSNECTDTTFWTEA